MKIAVINGNMRHGSTWHCMDAIVHAIEQHEAVERKEFSLPRDLPNFCNGCFFCFYHGENTCPHAQFVQPIVRAMEEADLIILASPIYGLDVSGQMKALIDHLCYMWMSHRPNPNMFAKVGLTVATTAGMGLNHATKTMRNSLTFWGVKNIYSYKNPIAAMNWDDVSGAKRQKLNKAAAKIAVGITRSVRRAKTSPNPILRSFMFRMMAGMQKTNDWNKTDRGHWEKQGGRTGLKPF